MAVLWLLIVNHVSTQSPQFQDFSQKGEKSPYSGLFLTLGSVFPTGATEADLLKIYRPRPGLPFTYATLENGTKRILWTTFTSQQVDIDVLHPQGEAYLKSILQTFQENGVSMIRLDALGYAIKKPGMSCFMIPETFDFIAELSAYAKSLGIEVLVEVHSYYRQQIAIAERVDRVYDFALPPLILHAFYNRTARILKQWLAISPRNAVTVLDTRDGIGVIDVGAGSKDPVSAAGLVPPEELDALVETIHEKSSGQSRLATGEAASNLDLYQVNGLARIVFLVYPCQSTTIRKIRVQKRLKDRPGAGIPRCKCQCSGRRSRRIGGRSCRRARCAPG